MKKELGPAQTQEDQPGREIEMEPQPDFRPRFPGSHRLDDKVAIITGGDSGIGRACAILFAREGARIAVVYLEEDRDAAYTLQLIEDEGSQGILLRGDIGDPRFCIHVVSEVKEKWGRLDILINNAAEQHPREGGLEDISDEQLMATFRTNVFGIFHLTKASLSLLKDGASIVNTTSVTAYRGSYHLIDYSASKGALIAFTRSLAQSLAHRNIRVNAVAPGPIWTPLIPSTFPADKVQNFGVDQPLGRAGEPKEVASCHLFLACDDSSYMSGQVLHPNGGEVVGS